MTIKFQNPIAQAVFDEARRITTEDLKALGVEYELNCDSEQRIRLKEIATKHHLDGFLAAAETAAKIEREGPGYESPWETEPMPDFSGIELVENRKKIIEIESDIQKLLTALSLAITEHTGPRVCDTYRHLSVKYAEKS